eukprot:TRINITY_DN18933_c0_g1_i1.p1 TRINITY_DN18933_c0_g1~~TRINITY_DN18933_c0_g1_i1.p1  ORF type:complete len:364 (-),score=90.15 TRINITY_DN18933_c0_g1_i1:36-1127(-)
MGKPKGKPRRKGAPARPEYSIEDVLNKAEDYMDEYKYDLAQRFCERALEMDNDNTRALELTAGLLLEMGKVESAQHCLGRAIHLEPHTGHSKYLSLAQIMSGCESRDLYRKGIEIIKAKLSSTGVAENMAELSRDLSNAYVSIAEIYMSDLCDESEAQEQSKKCIELSIESDPTNPESLQAKANYALVTGNLEEAKESIDKSLALWLPQQLKFLENGYGDETHLSYTFRLSTAKLLLDLEEWDTATKVLESLTEEDDEVVASWYLLGWLNYLRSRTEPDYCGNSKFYLEKAVAVNQANPTDDQAMVEHIKELLSELQNVKDDSEGAENAVSKETELLEKEADDVAEILDKEAEDDVDEETMET